MADPELYSEIEPLLLRKKSLKEEVFELLHRRIVAGKYHPGEWLRQEEIAQQLGVSQTPVREALDGLVSVGLAQRIPYRGVRVPELTHTEIVDSYILRLILESASVRLAAYHITPVQSNELLELVAMTRNQVHLDDMSKQRQLNKMFHLAIARACGNQALAKLYELTSNMFPDWMLYEYLFRHPELLSASLEKELQEHQAIANAIAMHEVDLAYRFALEHIRNLGKELIEFLGVPAGLIKEKERQVGPFMHFDQFP